MLSARVLLNFTKYSQITPQGRLICKNQFYSTIPQINKSYELNYSKTKPQINISQMLVTFNGIQGKTFSRQYADLPDMPSKNKLEKYTFKTIGFILDITKWLILWTLKIIQKYIINNSKVQSGWQLLQKKIENARKK